MVYPLQNVLVLAICLFGYVASECPTPNNFKEFLDCTANGAEKYPIVEIDNGRVGGKCEYMPIAQTNVCSWKGIQYGQPPVGNLRFMAPKPAQKLTKTHWAMDFGNVCIPTLPVALGFEDCLYVNVYVPEICTTSNPCPVMIWIFGGLFLFGSGNNDFYGPENFMANGVVVVTFNYRVGPFGFLSTGDENIPGNAGLLDQHLAIKWVNNNINRFGGDSSSITLFGESAGAASVCYHCMSDASAGLFQKVIMQSGSCLNDWAINYNPRETLLKVAQKLGITGNNMTEITAKLQCAPAALVNLAAADVNLGNFSPQQPGLFSPSVDHNTPPFIPAKPRKIVNNRLQNNQPICHGAEVISGMNSDEGGLLRIYFAVDPTILSKIKNNKEIITPLKCELTPGSSESIAVGQKVYDYYFANSLDQWAFYDYSTGSMWLDGITTLLKALIASGKQVHHYYFDYCSGTNYVRNIFFPEVTCASGKMRAIHADELIYEFTQTLLTFPKLLEVLGFIVKDITQLIRSPADLKMGKQIAGSFSNFAKSGSPNPVGEAVNQLLGVNWLPTTTTSDIQVLEFDETNSMKPHPLIDAINFWENVCDLS